MRIKTRIIITAAVLIVVGILLKYASHPLRQSADVIEKRFFKIFPVGSRYVEVLEKLKIMGYTYQDRLNCGFSKQKNGYSGEVVGSMSIIAPIGEVWEFKGALPFVAKTSVTAHMGFDQAGNLIDIWIWKDNDVW